MSAMQFINISTASRYLKIACRGIRRLRSKSRKGAEASKLSIVVLIILNRLIIRNYFCYTFDFVDATFIWLTSNPGKCKNLFGPRKVNSSEEDY